MTNNEIKKGASENTCEKIKAIYPHITVTGDVDNPYYSIDWYDIEKQEMYRGYSSYKLPLVRKWLQEEFEVVEADIDDLINRQKAELDRFKKIETTVNSFWDEVMKLSIAKDAEKPTLEELLEYIEQLRAEAVKEFAKLCIDKSENGVIFSAEIPDFVKEWAGETND